MEEREWEVENLNLWLLLVKLLQEEVLTLTGYWGSEFIINIFKSMYFGALCEESLLNDSGPEDNYFKTLLKKDVLPNPRDCWYPLA